MASSKESLLKREKRLVLYGGGSLKKNIRTHKTLVKLSKKKNPSITYIPSSSEYGEMEFREFCENLGKKTKIKRFIYFPIDIPFSDAMKDLALSQDIIYLSGGNTFSFLKNLRDQKLLQSLNDFVSRGGVLSGLSAGAILLTPTIATASFPYFDRDTNSAKIKNKNGLRLTDFEFFPHYSHSPAYKKALLAHSRKTIYPIYAAPDLSSVVVENSKIRFVGPVHVFWNGRYFAPQK